jgi:hypothetical protein
MRARLGLLFGLSLMLGCGDAPDTGDDQASASASDPIEGAWSLVETTSVSNDSVLGNRPAVRLFVDGHFSLVREMGTAPRPAMLDSTATVAEVRAAWGPFEAQAGTYEIAGDTVITRPVVEKRPELMAPGTFRRSTYRVSGDTLWITFVANQNGPSPNPSIDKFVRAR